MPSSGAWPGRCKYPGHFNNMELAKCFLRLSRFTEVPKYNITPAELLVLQAGHSGNAGGDPISSLELIGQDGRSNEAELARLKNNYGNLKHREDGKDVPTVGYLFRGQGFALPQRFSDLGKKYAKLPFSGDYKPKDYAPKEGELPPDKEMDTSADPLIVGAPLSTIEKEQQEEGTVGASRTTDTLPTLEGAFNIAASPVGMPEAEAPDSPTPATRKRR